MTYRTQEFVPSTIAEDITFGIEIECFIPRDARAPYGGIVYDRRVGYHQTGNFDGRNFPGWSATRDASLETDLPNYWPVEFVSPVLKGQNGLEQIRKFFAWLESINARVNRTCGQHVHVGVESGSGSQDADEQAAWVANLIGLTSFYECALFAMTGSRYRDNNYYCRSIKSDGHRNQYKRVNQDVKNAASEQKYNTFRETSYGSSKFTALNLTSVFTNRTVEFRLWAGSTNITKALMHISVSLGLAELARRRNHNFTSEETPVRRSFRYSKAEGQVEKLMQGLGFIRTTRSAPACGFFGTYDELNKIRKEARRLARKFATPPNSNRPSQSESIRTYGPTGERLS